MRPLLLLALLQAGAAAAPPPQVQWTVRPDTVTVGEPFTVTLIVRADAGTALAFPPGPDSSQNVEAVDPPTIAGGTEANGAPYRTATYRLVAWETGAQAVPFDAVTVGEGAATRRYDVRPGVFVRSVLPDDSTRRVPKPALGVLRTRLPWWPFALGALAAVLAVLWWRRRRARRAVVPPPTALAAARDALAQVDALGLLEGGEPSRYVALYAEVLRGYLGARAAVVTRAHTTGELAAALLGHGLPLDRITAVLEEADQVQFARRAVSPERARETAREVRALLEACDEHFARGITPPKGRAA